MPGSVSSTTPFSITRDLSLSQQKLNTVFEELSTGSRVFDATKTPSDSAVVFGMDARLKSIESALQNILQAESMIQCAISSLSDTSDLLSELSKIVVAAGNGLNSDYSCFDETFQKLLEQIDINANVKWDGTSLLAGGSGSTTTVSPITSGTASNSGFALGSVNASTIITNYDGTTYTVSLMVGNQRFQGTATPNGATTGSVFLTSVIDPSSQVTIPNVNFTNGSSSAALSSAIYTAAGLGSATPTQFYPVNAVTSAAANALVTSITPSATSSTGNYYLTYGTDGTNAIFKWQGADCFYTSTFSISTITTNTGTPSTSFSGPLTLQDGTTITLNNFDLTNVNELKGVIVSVIQNSGQSFTLQTGDDYTQTTTISMGVATINSLGLSGCSANSQFAAQQSISSIQTAIDIVSKQISMCSAHKLQLEEARKNLDVLSFNKQVERSNYADTDVSSRIIDATTYKSLVDSSSSALVAILEYPKKLAELVKRVQG